MSILNETIFKNSSIKGTDLYFIHIPKNGGTSFENHFLETSLGHYPITMYDQSIHDKTVAIVRNPYTRLISCYNYSKMEKSYWHSTDASTRFGKHDLYDYCCSHTFEEFIEDVCVTRTLFNHLQIKPQFTWVMNNKGKIPTNIIHLENMNEELSSLFGFEVNMSKINTSNTNNYSGYFTTDMENKVQHAFRKDFELFGPFESTIQ